MKTTLSILIGIFTVLVTQAQENSGRNSHFWLTLKPLAGTVAASDSDLVLDNGYRKLDLSSSELSCTRVDGPNGGWVYQIRWSGNRLVGNHNPDPVTFNVYVDGYSGSQFVYTANNNNGTVSSLGSLSTPSDLNNGWGVGNDVDIDAGESLQMTIQDFKVRGINVEDAGFELNTEIESIFVRETNGGNNHHMIFGLGNGLDTHNFSSGTSTRTFSGLGNSFIVTAAGSNAVNREWAIDELRFNFHLRNPALTWDDPANPFADIRNGGALGTTPYEPTTVAKLNNAYPNFSWDRIPRMMIVRHGQAGNAGYTDEQIEAMAKSFDLIMLEKANGGHKGYQRTANRLKAFNPDIKVVFYWNSTIYFGNYGVDDLIDSRPDFIADGEIRNNATYNRDNPDFIDWWAGLAHKMMGLVSGTTVDGTALQPSSIDGVFVDKTGVPVSMLQPLYEGATNSNFIMNNNGSNSRNRIAYLDGTYREAWQNGGDPASIAFSIALAQESGINNKMMTLKNPIKNLTTQKELESATDWTLGIHLIASGNYGYYNVSASVDATDPQHYWLTNYFDQFQRPLGQPLDYAIKDGSVYTRGFEHCDVYLDIDAAEDKVHSPIIANKVARIMWKNDIGNPGLAGSGFSQTDDTYTIKGGGNISGSADNFFFLSDLHYGNGVVGARLDSLQNTNKNARAGVMFRERIEATDVSTNDLSYVDSYINAYGNGQVLTSGARTVMVSRNPAGQISMLYRSTEGGTLTSAGTVGANVGPYVRIVRNGNTFTGQASTSGNDMTWTNIASVNIDMAEKTEMGMAVTSTNNSALAEAKFSNFYRIETESNFAFALPIIFVPDQIVTMRKVNASSYAIDGGNGGAKGQNVYLWSFNGNNINQQWVEVNRGNGYFSYQKNSTIYALDGGAAGAKGQNLYLWTAGDNNFNQHWAKVQISGNTYRLEKRNASGFSIDGGAGGAKAQNVYLWSSGNNNQNMQWIIE